VNRAASNNAVVAGGRTTPSPTDDAGARNRPGRVPVTETRPVTATVLYPDNTIRHVQLVGEDSERFNKIKEHVGDPDVTAVSISDQDGPVAVGWKVIDGGRKGLRPNKLASAVVDGLVAGTMVITGPGRGSEESLTSIHEGFRLALDRMAREAASEIGHADSVL